MKFLSDRMTSASGSIGGTTFSHNRYGLYTRSRRIPVNPNTGRQQAARNRFTSAASNWRDLSEEIRESWRAYATASPVSNSLGMSVYLTGAQAYVAAAAFAALIGDPPVGEAPDQAGRVPIGVPSVIVHATTKVVDVSGIDPSVLKVALSFGDAISAGRTFIRGPFQVRKTGAVAAGLFSYSPNAAGRNGVPFSIGESYPWRLAGNSTAGRLSTIATGIAIAVA